jgi:hypothetical protein
MSSAQSSMLDHKATQYTLCFGGLILHSYEMGFNIISPAWKQGMAAFSAFHSASDLSKTMTHKNVSCMNYFHKFPQQAKRFSVFYGIKSFFTVFRRANPGFVLNKKYPCNILPSFIKTHFTTFPNTHRSLKWYLISIFHNEECYPFLNYTCY